MSIKALPTELKLNIILHLDAESTLMFALTCRQHADMCQSFLDRHTRLFSEWQVLNLGENKREQGPSGGKAIWSILKEVLQDPEKGNYVHELNLPLKRQHLYNISAFGSVRTPPSPLLKLDQVLFRAAIREFRGLYDNTGDATAELMTALEKRLEHDEAILAILVHHLPIFKTIRISGMTAACIVPLMNQITRVYGDPTKA